MTSIASAAFIGHGKSAVIVGGGYIGLETAASMRKLGMNVTVLEALPRVLQRVTAPEVSAFYSRVHGEEGVRHHHRRRGGIPAGQRRRDQQSSWPMAPPSTRTWSSSASACCPKPNSPEQAGLAVDNGIVVDEFRAHLGP